ncbi:Tll0287-like domain-containing protein [Bradyrhizobium iriomotense]|uniref:Tll0287-like domain-containing protein n=1 Tax=Bradyrhizobium iriomotense TaxID=441950 RepID=UPI001B8A226D|nr:DUF3365 domain-containing protein [Bradyrhizobium iriomotense]MBR0784838.1 DUF3365 domain-containing protein [Bradyrhizobium iriomotense]
MIALILMGTIPASVICAAPEREDPSEDLSIGNSLADMLVAGETVISREQDRINDPKLGDKGLSGGALIERAREIYRATNGIDPASVDPASRHGRLLRAQMDAIIEVMDANQATINATGTGFKGFIPAVFARLVNEAFARRAKGEAEVKVTGPPDRIRNRKARPDAWEADVIKSKLLASNWLRDQAYSAAVETRGRPAFRVMVPQYYDQTCLACHGSPKGEVDITGYPKEGAKLDELGGVISIILYR